MYIYAILSVAAVGHINQWRSQVICIGREPAVCWPLVSREANNTRSRASREIT